MIEEWWIVCEKDRNKWVTQSIASTLTHRPKTHGNRLRHDASRRHIFLTRTTHVQPSVTPPTHPPCGWHRCLLRCRVTFRLCQGLRKMVLYVSTILTRIQETLSIEHKNPDKVRDKVRTHTGVWACVGCDGTLLATAYPSLCGQGRC
jgi:hypothetical protein